MVKKPPSTGYGFFGKNSKEEVTRGYSTKTLYAILINYRNKRLFGYCEYLFLGMGE